MRWSEIKIDTTPEGIDPLCARLCALGIEGFRIEDEEDFLSFLENNKKQWDYVDEELVDSMRGVCRVVFYLDPEDFETLAAVKSALSGIAELNPGVDMGPLRMTVSDRDEEEWAEAWKQYYKPMTVGSRLFIRPEWEDQETPEGRVTLITNPGMAFGTGTHASTRLCLEFIEEIIGKTGEGERIADLGCGSGILSCAALLLGANSAVGVDIDPNAADISVRNAALNGADDRYTAYCGDLTEDAGLVDRLAGMGVNVVFANIVADVIIALIPTFKKIAPGGRLIASGIIDIRKDEVTAALEAAGIVIDGVKREDGWVALLGTI